jgi:hypothetical protein
VKLWYCIQGLPYISTLSISCNKTIHDLKKQIQQEVPHFLERYHPMSLELKKVRYIKIFTRILT